MTLEELNKLIDTIYLLSPAAYEQIVAEIARANGSRLPILLHRLDPGQRLFRSRINVSGSFDHISDMGPPPDEVVHSFSRANRPHQSVFYLSENRPTSYMELFWHWATLDNVNSIIDITITEWAVQQSFELAVIAQPDRPQRQTVMEHVVGDEFDDKVGRLTAPDQAAARALMTTLYRQFSLDVPHGSNELYLPTCAWSNMAYLHSTSSGIMYPSVRSGKEGMNFAIAKPDAISSLRLESAARDTFRHVAFRRPAQIAPSQAASIDQIACRIRW